MLLEVNRQLFPSIFGGLQDLLLCLQETRKVALRSIVYATFWPSTFTPGRFAPVPHPLAFSKQWRELGDSAAGRANDSFGVCGWAGWSCGSEPANPRGTTPCQTLPGKCTDIHELTSPAWAGEGAGWQGRQSRSNQREATFRREEKKAGADAEGRVASRQKRAGATPEMEDPERRSPSWLHSHIPSLAEASKAARNRMRWFSAELCSGPDQSPSIIYSSSGSRGGGFQEPSGWDLRLPMQLRGAGGRQLRVSLFAHFNSRLSSPRGAPSPPPARAESSDVVSARRSWSPDPSSRRQRVLVTPRLI